MVSTRDQQSTGFTGELSRDYFFCGSVVEGPHLGDLGETTDSKLLTDNEFGYWFDFVIQINFNPSTHPLSFE